MKKKYCHFYVETSRFCSKQPSCDTCELQPRPNVVKYTVEGLNKLSKQLHEFQLKKGFDDPDEFRRITLIASEAFEALEAFREDNYANLTESQKKVLSGWIDNEDFKERFENTVKNTLEDELADIIARTLAFCGEKGIDIEYHLQNKMRYNDTRGYKYGGKKF